MRKAPTRFLPLLLAGAIAGGSLMPSLAAHAANQNIEVCGDGTGLLGSLTSLEQSAFRVHLRLNSQHYRAYANDAADTAYTLDFLRREGEQEKLADAGYICISAGLMDIITPLRAQSEVYLAETGCAQYSDLFSDVPEEQLAAYADELAACVTANKDAIAENYKAIAQELQQYESARVLLMTVYNPLAGGKALSPERQACYNKVSDAVDTLLTETVNPLIRELGETYGYTVVDAYAVFDGKEGYTSPEALDPYPTAAGYQALGTAFLEALDAEVPEGYVPGDVDKDGAINASDAAQVLIHAAASGADQSGAGTLEIVGEILSADYNRDGTINASDAALILIYSAEQGASSE